MAPRSSSMLALLGLLAVAGYQNRDKIGQLLRQGGVRPSGGQGGMGQQQQGGLGAGGGLGTGSGLGAGSGLGGLLGGLGGLLGGGSAGGMLSGGLGEIIDRLKQGGQGQAADSWVSRGPNSEVAPNDLEQAIGPDVLDELSQRTGLPREELLARLSRELPRAVDDLTPEGHIPTEEEASRFGSAGTSPDGSPQPS